MGVISDWTVGGKGGLSLLDQMLIANPRHFFFLPCPHAHTVTIFLHPLDLNILPSKQTIAMYLLAETPPEFEALIWPPPLPPSPTAGGMNC